MLKAEDFLDEVRMAHRLKTKAYDLELTAYIDYVLDEFVRVGIDAKEKTPAITNCVIAYTKTQFGNSDAAKKADWGITYDRLLTGLVV